MTHILLCPVGSDNRLSRNQGQTNMKWPAQLFLNCLGPKVWLTDLFGELQLS
jgi:hypothetical protein